MPRVQGQGKYLQPDMASFRQGLDMFHAAVASRMFEEVNDLQDRIVSASRTLGASSSSLFDQLLELEVVIESSGVFEIVSHWLATQDNTVLTEAQRDLACQRIKETYLKTVRRIMAVSAQTLLRVDHVRVEGSALGLEHCDDPLMRLDAEVLDQLETAVTRLNGEFSQLTDDKDVLQKAIDLLQSRGWWERVKDLLPTVEEIDALISMATVKVYDANLIKLALGRVGKYVDFFEGGNNFTALTTARARINDALDRKYLEIKDNRKKIESYNRRTEKVDRHQELLQARTQWLATVECIGDGVQQFSLQCEVMLSATEGAIREAPGQLAEFVRFLRPIKR